MIKKKKYPKISPSLVKNQTGKKVEIYLKYDAYESILEKMDELNKKISELKKKKLAKKT